VLYTVIDKTLKLSQAIYGDKTEVVVSRLWDRMQEQLKKAPEPCWAGTTAIRTGVTSPRTTSRHTRNSSRIRGRSRFW